MFIRVLVVCAFIGPRREPTQRASSFLLLQASKVVSISSHIAFREVAVGGASSHVAAPLSNFGFWESRKSHSGQLAEKPFLDKSFG